VLKFYRDFVMSGLPDELTVYAGALSTPDGHPVIGLIPAWCGDVAEGERCLEPLRKFGSPIADLICTMPYTAMQQMLDGACPFGLRSYWKSRFLHDLPDSAIDTFVQFAETRSSPYSFAILEHAHGAVSRVAYSAGSHRQNARILPLSVDSWRTSQSHSSRRSEGMISAKRS
jgi:hypothetical protein